MNMARPNNYVLGTTPELYWTPTDQDGEFFTPTDMTLRVKNPDGTIFSISGGDIPTASGYFYYIYEPETVGWYEYEVIVDHADGRSLAETKGFEIYDHVYPD